MRRLDPYHRSAAAAPSVDSGVQRRQDHLEGVLLHLVRGRIPIDVAGDLVLADLVAA